MKILALNPGSGTFRYKLLAMPQGCWGERRRGRAQRRKHRPRARRGDGRGGRAGRRRVPASRHRRHRLPRRARRVPVRRSGADYAGGVRGGPFARGPGAAPQPDRPGRHRGGLAAGAGSAGRGRLRHGVPSDVARGRVALRPAGGGRRRRRTPAVRLPRYRAPLRPRATARVPGRDAVGSRPDPLPPRRRRERLRRARRPERRYQHGAHAAGGPRHEHALRRPGPRPRAPPDSA